MDRQLATIMLLLASCSAVGGAQRMRTIRGTVVDTVNRPVPGVSIIPRSGESVTTDDSGRFRLAFDATQGAAFDLRRIGYLPSRYGLVAGGDTEIVIKMLPGPAQLPVVRVKSNFAVPAPLAGFEARKAARARGAGSGYFVTSDDIDKMGASLASQVFASVPTLAVHPANGSTDRFGLFGRSAEGGECPVTIYLDGALHAPASEATRTPATTRRRGAIASQTSTGPINVVDDIVTPSEIAGIEVYSSGLMAPVQFQPNDWNQKMCTVVLIWTKHYRPPT